MERDILEGLLPQSSWGNPSKDRRVNIGIGVEKKRCCDFNTW
jgi:hypothetical protein